MHQEHPQWGALKGEYVGILAPRNILLNIKRTKPFMSINKPKCVSCLLGILTDNQLEIKSKRTKLRSLVVLFGSSFTFIYRHSHPTNFNTWSLTTCTTDESDVNHGLRSDHDPRSARLFPELRPKAVSVGLLQLRQDKPSCSPGSCPSSL
jgi:hypothetical protein